MKIPIVYAALAAACLSVAPSALGQVPQVQPPADSISKFAWQTTETQPLAHAGSANYAPPTPEQQARAEQAARLGGTAFLSLRAGHYKEAEAEARASMSLEPGGVANQVLAAALDAQGKEQEALQAYHALVIDSNGRLGGQTRDLLPYALLLLKSGQWVQALAAYNRAISSLPSVGPHRERPIVQDEDVIRANSHFSPDTPEPTALATAIHIARGLVYNASPDWAGESQNKEAMAEYGEALKLAPNSPLTNYYYGTGWQQLSPAERAKFGSVQQAKAALQKAVLLGKGDVKRAALKALKNFNKPA